MGEPSSASGSEVTDKPNPSGDAALEGEPPFNVSGELVPDARALRRAATDCGLEIASLIWEAIDETFALKVALLGGVKKSLADDGEERTTPLGLRLA